jgi:hypothetical protein
VSRRLETALAGVLDDRGLTMVGVDHSTLKGEPSGTDTRYSVSLVGPIDDVWAEAYRILQADSTMFRRLRLDAPARQVTFTCRAIDGPAQVFEILERLDALIKRVNRQTLGRRT